MRTGLPMPTIRGAIRCGELGALQANARTIRIPEPDLSAGWTCSGGARNECSSGDANNNHNLAQVAREAAFLYREITAAPSESTAQQISLT